MTEKASPVAWGFVCKPKAKGGLGIRQLEAWNNVTSSRYVWDISSKKDNLQVKWVDHKHLKKIDWWSTRFL